MWEPGQPEKLGISSYPCPRHGTFCSVTSAGRGDGTNCTGSERGGINTFHSFCQLQPSDVVFGAPLRLDRELQAIVI